MCVSGTVSLNVLGGLQVGNPRALAETNEMPSISADNNEKFSLVWFGLVWFGLVWFTEGFLRYANNHIIQKSKLENIFVSIP